MFIYSDGKEIARWEERHRFMCCVGIESLPTVMRPLFKAPGKYRTISRNLRQNNHNPVVFEVEPSEHWLCPAQYVLPGGRVVYICKPFLKVLTGKTKITERTTVTLRVSLCKTKKEG